MTLRLILVRHAKSSWAHPGLRDHARPLNGRGRRSAEAIGIWLAGQGFAPDEALSSDSRRTRETWACIAAAFGDAPEPDWRKDLYHASPDRMLDALRGARGGTVLVLGHNPGCASFAARLVGRAPDHARFRDFPTAATLVAETDAGSWSDLGWGGARALAFAVPRDLGVS